VFFGDLVLLNLCQDTDSGMVWTSASYLHSCVV